MNTPPATVTSWEAHQGPGRRIAAGSTRGDHLLALFGFVAHAVFFAALGAGACLLWPEGAWGVFLASGVAAVILLLARGAQVGLSTTRESLAALREAWGRRR